MENSGYREVLQQNSRLLTTLLDISNLVSSTMELKPLLEAILDKLRTIIEYKNAKIFITDGSRASVIAHRSVIPEGMERNFPLPFGDWLANEKKPIVIDDLLSDDELAVRFRNDMSGFLSSVYKDVRCWMSLPMIYKDRVVGIMTLDHSEPGYYRTYHTELGKAFANQAAIEYENAKLFNEMSKRADETKTLLSIQQAITSRLEQDSVLRLIAGEARRLTNSNSTAVYLVDENAGELELAVLSGVNQTGLTGMRIPVRGSAAGESLLLHESIIFDRKRLENTPEHELAVITGMNTCLYVPLFAGSRPVGVIAAFSRVEGEFNAEDERIFSMFAPSAVIGIENARLYQEEKKELQENEQRRYVAEGLRDILRALNSNRSLDDILEFILKEAARLLHTDTAALFRLADDKKTLSLEASCGLPHYVGNEIRVSSDDGILGRAFMERRPIVRSDLSGIDSLYKGNPVQDAHLSWLHDNCSGMMAVPLICKDEVYGGIALYFRKDERQPSRTITKEEVGLAMTFADQAALAIDNTRLRKQAEDMAVTAERNRLARDLHDAVTQTLFSSSLIAEVLPKIWERNREEGMKRLEELRQMTRGALAEMRTLLFELRPATLVEAPLGDLLRQLSEAVTGRARIPVSLEVKGTAKLPPEVKIVFYRITQEALNNIAKHSGASKAAIVLNANEDEQLGVLVANLTISDDGKGFDPGSVTSEHFGIGIMRERAESAGAKLKVTSEPGSGTVIELEWVGSITHN